MHKKGGIPSALTSAYGFIVIVMITLFFFILFQINSKTITVDVESEQYQLEAEEVLVQYLNSPVFDEQTEKTLKIYELISRINDEHYKALLTRETEQIFSGLAGPGFGGGWTIHIFGPPLNLPVFSYTAVLPGMSTNNFLGVLMMQSNRKAATTKAEFTIPQPNNQQGYTVSLSA